MRWMRRIRRFPVDGDKRASRRFLILPKQIDGEWRWLEAAAWEETHYVWGSHTGWHRQRWLTEEEYEDRRGRGRWYK